MIHPCDRQMESQTGGPTDDKRQEDIV